MTLPRPIRSSWRSFKARCIPLPRRWARRCGAPRSRPTSRSAATTPAPSSTARRRVIAMGDHMPVHLGSMPMSVQAAVAAIDFAPGDIAILNDPYRRRNASSGYHHGAAGLSARRRIRACLLCFESRPPRRCGRNVCRIDGTGERDLSGGHSHSSGADCARRTSRPRDARPDPAERAHAEGARRRSGVADRRLPRRRAARAAVGWRSTASRSCRR